MIRRVDLGHFNAAWLAEEVTQVAESQASFLAGALPQLPAAVDRLLTYAQGGDGTEQRTQQALADVALVGRVLWSAAHPDVLDQARLPWLPGHDHQEPFAIETVLAAAMGRVELHYRRPLTKPMLAALAGITDRTLKSHISRGHVATVVLPGRHDAARGIPALEAARWLAQRGVALADDLSQEVEADQERRMAEQERLAAGVVSGGVSGLDDP